MPSCLPHRGFSFVEVLFAVIILGVGFIMIAAVFPVAIRQTKNTVDETSAAAIARAGTNYIAQYATNVNMPQDNNAVTDGMVAVPAFNQSAPTNPNFTFWQQIRGNVVSQDDPRYAYVSMYFRGVDVNTLVNPNTYIPHPYAQVITICVQATEAPTFSAADYFNSAPGTDTAAHRVNLQPRPVLVNIANGAPGDVDLIGFQDETGAYPDAWLGAHNAVAEGAYVVIRTDTQNGGAMIGNIFRVGARRAEFDNTNGTVHSYLSTGGNVAANFVNEQVWELVPGNDFTPIAGAPPVEAPAGSTNLTDQAWIVGRSVEPGTDASTSQFAGPAMDVSAYSTYVAITQ